MSVLALADVRWRSRRNSAGGPPLVHVSFLRDGGDGQILATIGGILGYFVSLVGQPRRAYDADVPATIAGDRRLGHGLADLCGEWFRWTSLGLAEALPAYVTDALGRAGIDSPPALRLRLFDLVNERYAGFVPAARRAEALVGLAGSLGLGPDDSMDLDRALVLDADEEAVLVCEEQPSAMEVMARYNRAALAALLRQAVSVTVTLHAPSGGLIRRLYAFCRRLGVYCEIEQAALLGEVFQVTIAGPDAVVGPPAAAGPRLAGVVLYLLRQLGPADTAAAELVLRERPCRLLLDRALLRLPGLAGVDGEGEADGGAPAGAVREDTGEYEAAAFDSEVEARLAREFAALRRQGRAAGWGLVREPSPLLAGRRVLLPDFALVRGEMRVFVEIAGFWTAGYLAKKRQALEQLPPETPLLLAVAPPAAEALAGLPFPSVPYRDTVPVVRLLALAEMHYGDFAVRTAGAAERLAVACASAADGRLSEETLADLLGCHSPGEVTRALAATSVPAGWIRVPGAGLCGPALREAIEAMLAEAWTAGPDARLTLSELRARLPDAALPESEEALAALLERLPSCRVVRGSLFAVELLPADGERWKVDALGTDARLIAVAGATDGAVNRAAGKAGSRGRKRPSSPERGIRPLF